MDPLLPEVSGEDTRERHNQRHSRNGDAGFVLKSDHQIQSGAVPSGVIVKNVGDRLHVGHKDWLGFGEDRDYFS
jgi:hypothetical protein